MPIRVFELARDLGISSKDLIDKCHAAGFDVKGHMSIFDDHQARLVRAMFPPPSTEEIASREAAEEDRKRKATDRKLAREAKQRAEEEKAAAEAAAAAAAAAAAEAAAEAARQPAPAEETAPEEAAQAAPQAAPVAAEAAGGAPPAEPQPESEVAATAEMSQDGAKSIAKEKEKAKGKKRPRDKADDKLPPLLKPVLNFPRIGLVKPASEVEYSDETPAAQRKGEGGEPADSGLDEESSVLDRIPRSALARERRRRARAPRSRRRGGRGKSKGGASEAAVAKTAVETGKAEATSPITMRSLSEAMGVKTSSLLEAFIKHEIFLTINDVVPDEVAQLVAMDFGVELTVKKAKGAEELFEENVERDEVASSEADRRPRAPVVAFLGHVDHGKTSLLDAIRQAHVAATESGGITQHIGAYTASSAKGPVTFLDTPGHQAFTEMRARGANATDIVVLVVAADDGVMPQTEEAISHAKAAEVPIVVALNKMDLPSANPMRVKQQLAAKGLELEEWGGQVGVVEVSATTGKGLDVLIERLALEAELLELTADPTKKAVGVVLEGRLSEGRGVVASVLVREGTLHRGDTILSGPSFGRVRMIYNDRSEEIEEAGPSTPVEVTGFSTVPEAGARFNVMSDPDEARKIGESRQAQVRQEAMAARKRFSLDAFFAQAKGAAGIAELPLILKADVKGSIEVISKEVESIATDDAKVKILHEGLGAINVTDVALAEASKAVVIGFHVGVDPEARKSAEARGVEIRLHKIIYDLKDEVKKALEGRLAPEQREKVTGHLEVRNVFNISRVGTVAGCYVLDGTVSRADRTRLTRGGTVVHEGRMWSLKHLKDDVREIRSGFECGVKIDGYDDVHVGDLIETFQIEQVARTLE